MKSIPQFILFSLSVLFSIPLVIHADTAVDAQPDKGSIVQSPENRVVLLELYTSEGCSSCPPADHFLSGLKDAGISSKQLIPLAFHVTYWDYIGWQDRFADKAFDERQRLQARRNKQRTIYTPQFMMSGDDYRRYTSFEKDIAKAVRQPAAVDLTLSSSRKGNELELVLVTDSSRDKGADIGVYFAVVENNLSSAVEDGENEGKTLHHDYVVRELHGPYRQRTVSRQENSLSVILKQAWKLKDLHIVAFAEDQRSGDILQAVRLKP